MKSRSLIKYGAVLASIVFLCTSDISLQTGLAQDPDPPCRTASDLSTEQIFSNVGYAYNFDGSTNAGFILQSAHALLTNGPCDVDKYKVPWTINICGLDQYAPGFFTVVPCDCRAQSVLGIKLKFSQNYNINGNVIDPRKFTYAMTIDPTPVHPSAFCPF